MDREAAEKLILVLAVLLLIPSVFGALGTSLNYDILTYLPKNLDARLISARRLWRITSIWHRFPVITVEDMSTPDTLKLKSDLEGVEGRTEGHVDERFYRCDDAEGNASERYSEVLL